MEIIPVVESLEVELRRIQNPASAIAGLTSDLRGVWPSVALLVAAFAAFVGLVRRLRLLILRFGKGRSVAYHPIATAPFDEFSDVSSDEGDDSDEDVEDDEEKDDSLSSIVASDGFESVVGLDGVCGEDRREGSCGMWPELGWGDGAVVRKWDGLGLGSNLSTGGGLISLLDLDRGQVLRSFASCGSSGPSAMSLVSPAVLISATAAEVEWATGSGAAVAVWDARAAGERTPSATAKWQTLRRRRVVGIAGGGNGRVYIGDDGGMVTTADLRKGKSTSAAPVVETWWDAAIAVKADNGEDDTEAWRRNAVSIVPILPSPK